RVKSWCLSARFGSCRLRPRPWNAALGKYSAASSARFPRERTVRSMRVVVNCLAAIGRKTGVGHHTADLVRCLRRQAGRRIVTFPDGWMEQVCRTGARLQPWLSAQRGQATHGGGSGRISLASRCKGFALEQARRAKQAVLTRELQALLH